MIGIHASHQSGKISHIIWLAMTKWAHVVGGVHAGDKILPTVKLGFALVIHSRIDAKKAFSRYGIHSECIGIGGICRNTKQTMLRLVIEVLNSRSITTDSKI